MVRKLIAKAGWSSKAGVNQPVHWFLGGKGLGIQQGTSVWVGWPKSHVTHVKFMFYDMCLLPTLNSSINVRGILVWKEISIGHTKFLVKVELTWVQNHGSFIKSS